MPTVRIFGHDGIKQMPSVRPTQFASDSVYQLLQPYIFAQSLSVSSGAAVSSAPYSDPRTNVLRVEVPDGVTVAYEINPPGRATDATANSPRLSGKDQFYFKDGWTISMIDVTSVP